MMVPEIPNGFVRLSRQILDSEIWDKPPFYLKLWIYMLMKAMYEPKQDGQRLGRGQLLVTIRELSEAAAYKKGACVITPTKDQTWGALNWMRGVRRVHDSKPPMCTTAKTTRGLIITICNYERYQNLDNYKTTACTTGSPLETQHGSKEGKKEETTTLVGFNQFWNLWPKHQRKAAKAKCLAMWRKKKLEADVEHVLAVLKAHKAGDQWTKDGGQFIPAPYQWLKNDRWDTEVSDASVATEPEWEGRDPTEAEVAAWRQAG